MYFNLQNKTKLIFYFLFNLICLPLFILNYLLTFPLYLRKSKRKIALVLVDQPLGHLIYFVKGLRNMERVIIFVRFEKHRKLLEEVLNSKKIVLLPISKLNLITLWKYQVYKLYFQNIYFLKTRDMFRLTMKCFYVKVFVPAGQNPKKSELISGSLLVQSFVNLWSLQTWMFKSWEAYKTRERELLYFLYSGSQQYLTNSKNDVDMNNVVIKQPKLRSVLSKNYIVINVFGSDRNRIIPDEYIRETIKNAKNYSIVFVGQYFEIDLIFEKYQKLFPEKNLVNLNNQTSFIEIFKIIDSAKFVLTSETSILHIARLFHKKSAVFVSYNFDYKTQSECVVNTKHWIDNCDYPNQSLINKEILENYRHNYLKVVNEELNNYIKFLKNAI